MKTTITNTNTTSLKAFKTRDSDAVIMASLGHEDVYRLFTISETSRGFEINFKLFDARYESDRGYFIAELRSFDDAVKFVSDIYARRFEGGQIGCGPARLDPNSPSAIKLRIQVDHQVFDNMDYSTDQTLNA